MPAKKTVARHCNSVGSLLCKKAKKILRVELL
jgi:hypothetical protein